MEVVAGREVVVEVDRGTAIAGGCIDKVVVDGQPISD